MLVTLGVATTPTNCDLPRTRLRARVLGRYFIAKAIFLIRSFVSALISALSRSALTTVVRPTPAAFAISVIVAAIVIPLLARRAQPLPALSISRRGIQRQPDLVLPVQRKMRRDVELIRPVAVPPCHDRFFFTPNHLKEVLDQAHKPAELLIEDKGVRHDGFPGFGGPVLAVVENELGTGFPPRATSFRHIPRHVPRVSS